MFAGNLLTKVRLPVRLSTRMTNNVNRNYATRKHDHAAFSSEGQGIWDYIKDKLGIDTPKNPPREIENVRRVPVDVPPDPQQNSVEEIWKPGYRGRTDNQRY